MPEGIRCQQQPGRYTFIFYGGIMKRMKKTAAFLITVLLIAGCSNSASGSQGSGSPEPEEPGTRIVVDSAGSGGSGRNQQYHPIRRHGADVHLAAGGG